MDSINTETRLDFDYFNKNENIDTNTISDRLREYNEIAGLYVSYYPQIAEDEDVDLIYMEKANKKFAHPIKVKMIPEYLEEVIENRNNGIMILDTLHLEVEKGYFREKTQMDIPVRGDLIEVSYADLLFVIEDVVDSSSIFFGKKLNWKITGKIFIDSHENQDITNDRYEPGTAPGEKNNFDEKILDDIENTSDEEYTYTDKDNIFGDY